MSCKPAQQLNCFVLKLITIATVAPLKQIALLYDIASTEGLFSQVKGSEMHQPFVIHCSKTKASMISKSSDPSQFSHMELFIALTIQRESAKWHIPTTSC